MKKLAGKILVCASFATLLFLGFGQPTPAAVAQTQSQNQNQQMQSVTGKVTSIQSASFTVEVTDPSTSAKRTIDFTMDSHTTVSGKVNLGDNAVVQYRVTDDGKNLAVHIAPEQA